MQSIADAAKNAATVATNAVSGAATSAAEYTGLAAPTIGHSHAEEHSAHSTLPPDAQVSDVKPMDDVALAVFESKEVRHEVLVKINQLALDDQKHGLKELKELELVTDKGKRGIDGEIKLAYALQFYHPRRYITIHRPMGIDYIGEIEIEDGKAIHVRCHKASAGGTATFHSIDTRPGNEGGAVFKTGEKLVWFDY